MTVVIAITGIPGSGRSTQANGLARVWCCDEPLAADEFDTTPDQPLAEMQSWLASGGDAGDLDVSRTIRELEQRISFPSGRSAGSDPSETVILMTSFCGRSHPRLSSEIDIQCWIDTARDVAMARQLRKWSLELLNPAICMTASERISWIAEYCDGYLHTVQDLLQWQERHVRPRSDIIVDGSGTPAQVLQQLLIQVSAGSRSFRAAG